MHHNEIWIIFGHLNFRMLSHFFFIALKKKIPSDKIYFLTNAHNTYSLWLYLYTLHHILVLNASLSRCLKLSQSQSYKKVQEMILNEEGNVNCLQYNVIVSNRSMTALQIIPINYLLKGSIEEKRFWYLETPFRLCKFVRMNRSYANTSRILHYSFTWFFSLKCSTTQNVKHTTQGQ